MPALAGVTTTLSQNKKRRPEGRRFTISKLTLAQLVCWIAESIQVALVGRTKVQSSVASTG